MPQLRSSEIFYITGADRHLFGPICSLLASFKHRVPDRKVWVADFGFTPDQRALLSSLGVLLEMPDSVRNQLPPDAPIDRAELALAWYSKASLLEYVRNHTFDALMWIDADIIVTGDLASEAERLARRMQAENKFFAATPTFSGDNLGRYIQRQLERGPNYNVVPFAANLVNLGVDLGHPYLNSGVFVARDLDALARWRYLTCATPAHFLFEQNAFNVIAWMAPDCVELLDLKRWNLNSLLLASTGVSAAGGMPAVHCGDTETLLVHATSPRHEDCHWGDYAVDCAGGRFAIKMKFFGNPGLRALQEKYLHEFINFAQEEIAAAGLADKSAAA